MRGCGLPYDVGGLIETRDELIVNTPQKYTALTGARVLTGREAVGLNAATKTVTAKNLTSGETETYEYDSLIIATGASSVIPPIEGAAQQGVFKPRTPDDAIALRGYLEQNAAKKAVVIGGGFIGLEAAENLLAQGLGVTVIDVAGQIMPGVLDAEMADFARKKLQAAGIRVMTGTAAQAILGDGRVTAVKTEAGTLPADVVVVSAGIRPNTAFLDGSGLEMVKGTIPVDGQLRTNLPNVYAAGDCAAPGDQPAHRCGPVVAHGLFRQHGRPHAGAGFDRREQALPRRAGHRCGQAARPELRPHRPDRGCRPSGGLRRGHRPDGQRRQGPLLPGFRLVCHQAHRGQDHSQAAGRSGAGPRRGGQDGGHRGDRHLHGCGVEDFDNLDLAYAPPFSTAIHPFVQAVYLLENKLEGKINSITPAEYQAGAAKGCRVVDAAPAPAVHGATFVQLETLNGPVEGLDKDDKLLIVCSKGKRAYFMQNRLRSYGYTNTLVLEGATFFNDVRVETVGAKVSPAEVTRVKALGFLWDKRTPDKFNGRVITRNGKLTAAEQMAVAQAAEKFGSGEVTMTSRLTLEIQGVPFANIEPLREFLLNAGLEMGGTGSKVRPVVSCKGTTCQYGLIDTFALSQEIHERFYKGYHEVKLPHKFKIAVGGCPNNCVKPDLNDLGVIGQRIPQIQLDKCRGCKVCQIQETCPINVAKMENGKIRIDPEACNHCGRCVGKCPFKAVEGHVDGYRIYIGGRWGKKVAQGRYLDKVFTDRQEVLDVIEKAILLFREQGITGERFADTVARIGFEEVQRQLLDNELLARKEENLAAQKHMKGGATC